mgnify:CR=1 FL=1
MAPALRPRPTSRMSVVFCTAHASAPREQRKGRHEFRGSEANQGGFGARQDPEGGLMMCWFLEARCRRRWRAGRIRILVEAGSPRNTARLPAATRFEGYTWFEGYNWLGRTFEGRRLGSTSKPDRADLLRVACMLLREDKWAKYREMCRRSDRSRYGERSYAFREDTRCLSAWRSGPSGDQVHAPPERSARRLPPAQRVMLPDPVKLLRAGAARAHHRVALRGSSIHVRTGSRDDDEGRSGIS